MGQSYLIRPAPSEASPHPSQPRRVYTPMPDGFERFLRACVGLSPALGAIPRDRSS